MPRPYNRKKDDSQQRRDRLQPYIPESAGETVLVSGRIPVEMRDALDALPGDRSSKIKEAIANFINAAAVQSSDEPSP